MRSLRAIALAAALGAPLLGVAQPGRAAGEGGATKVPAVPQAAAATLVPAARTSPAPGPARSAAPRVAGEAPAPAGGKPARPTSPPAKAWRARARVTNEVAPGVLARAAARNQQARAPARPGCELPPEKRAPGTRCPLAPGQIESLEMDWNAPVAR